VGAVLEEDRYFLKVFRDEREIITTGEDGRKALKVVLAAKKSYMEESIVRLA
jgi:hypothetical protein